VVALCHFLRRGKLWIPDLRDAHFAEHLRRAQETPQKKKIAFILALSPSEVKYTFTHKSYFPGTVNSNQTANYSSKLISQELFTVKARIRSSPMKQHYAVITLFPFHSYLAPESLSGPVCNISSQLTVYQKLP